LPLDFATRIPDGDTVFLAIAYSKLPAATEAALFRCEVGAENLESPRELPIMGGRKLQRKRVYEKVSILSPGPQHPPRREEDDTYSKSERTSNGHNERVHDNNLQLDFDEADGAEVLRGESISMDLDDEEIEPDSAVGDDDNDDDGEEEDENSVDRLFERESAMIEASKREFENKKQEVLNQLPASYQDRFGQVGFGKYSKKFYPVMILGPYDVPHGKPAFIRENWMETFEKVRKRERKPFLCRSKFRVSHVTSVFVPCR
jgi:hypothetical protein